MDCFQEDVSGTLPAGLFDLTALTRLEVGGNPNLHGTLSPLIGKLTDLNSLAFYKNKMSGPLPPELGKLTKLTLLSLALNKFTGTVPEELGALSLATFFALHVNKFTGPVPESFAKLTKMSDRELNLHGNQLTGCVPRCIGYCEASTSAAPCVITNSGNAGVTGRCAHDCSTEAKDF